MIANGGNYSWMRTWRQSGDGLTASYGRVLVAFSRLSADGATTKKQAIGCATSLVRRLCNRRATRRADPCVQLLVLN